MKAVINGGKAFGHLRVTLGPGELITTQSDAMASMSAELDMTTALNGGFFRAFVRKLLGGETLFVNQFTNNTQNNSTLTLAQPIPGEMRSRKLNGDSFYMQPGAFLAATKGVTLGLKWAGLPSFIAGESLFKIQASGEGVVWFGAYGALIEKEIDGEYIIDTGHLVAYEQGIKLSPQLAGGISSSTLGKKGLVTRVKGKGKIIVQTRSLSGLSRWINPSL